MKRLISASIFAAALALGSTAPVFAQEATTQQIYQAAESGRMAEAQQMMEKVLRDHPASAKAHYVHSELLAKEGRYGEARAELDTAEKLGLSNVKPEAVQQLRQRINSAPRIGSGVSGAGSTPGSYSSGSYSGAGSSGGFGWGFVVLIALGGAAAFLISRALRARRVNRMNRAVAYGQNPGQNPGAAPYGMQGGQPGAPYGPQPYGPGYPPAGGGLGAGILGGLATGAAVGAGAVAAQSLLHHFTDSDRHAGSSAVPPPSSDYQPFDDMGGNNFGITDNSSSWDDAGSGGDSGGDFSGGSDW